LASGEVLSPGQDAAEALSGAGATASAPGHPPK